MITLAYDSTRLRARSGVLHAPNEAPHSANFTLCGLRWHSSSGVLALWTVYDGETHPPTCKRCVAALESRAARRSPRGEVFTCATPAR